MGLKVAEGSDGNYLRFGEGRGSLSRDAKRAVMRFPNFYIGSSAGHIARECLWAVYVTPDVAS